MSDEIKEQSLKGYMEELSNGRQVFVGWDESDPDDERTYFHFRNSDGEETQFALSKEAREALTKCLNRKWRGAYIWKAIVE